MILITGGGTGGHLSIAKSIKNELNLLDIKPMYVGSNAGQDRSWFENDDGFLEKIFLDSSSVVNKNLFGKISSLLNIFKESIKLIKIFKKYNIDKVFCVGGYSSAPASFCAIILRIDLYIHEQNAITGKLNSILKPFSKKFYSPTNSNYPVDKKFFESARERSDIKKVIFLGGSQGAIAINNFALSLAKNLESKNIKIVHQCGKKDFDRVKNEYKKLNIEVELFDFDSNLVSKIKEADFAISRSGASTMWELVANQIPTLFIPFPYSAGNHQYFNAKILSDKNLAFLKLENELNIEEFLDILDNKAKLIEISKNLKNEIFDNGAKEIAKDLI